MVKAILLKELKEMLRDGRFRLSLLITGTLLLVSIAVSYSYYQSVKKQFDEATASHRQNWETQTDKNPHAAAHFGTYVFKKKSFLSLIDAGTDKYTGIAFYLEPHRRNSPQYSVLQDETSLIRFGDLNPSFILLYLLPLLIMLLGFNAYTKERENGTWRLLLLQHAGKPVVAVGKWLSLFCLPVVFITATFLVLVIAQPFTRSFGDYSLTSISLLYLNYLLYNIVIINITLFVSSCTRSSGFSFLVLMAFWMTTSILAPKLTANIAETSYPAFSSSQLNSLAAQLKSNGIDGHNAGNEASKKLEKEILQQYGVDSLSQLPVNFAGIRLDRGEQLETRIYDSVFRLQKNSTQRQFTCFTNSSFLSPFTASKFISMGICHSDIYYHWHFADAAEQYRRLFVNMMNENIITHSKTGDTYKAGEELWKSVPRFSYQPPPVQDILNNQAYNIAVLMLWLLVSFIALAFSVTKMKA